MLVYPTSYPVPNGYKKKFLSGEEDLFATGSDLKVLCRVHKRATGINLEPYRKLFIPRVVKSGSPCLVKIEPRDYNFRCDPQIKLEFEFVNLSEFEAQMAALQRLYDMARLEVEYGRVYIPASSTEEASVKDVPTLVKLTPRGKNDRDSAAVAALSGLLKSEKCVPVRVTLEGKEKAAHRAAQDLNLPTDRPPWVDKCFSAAFAEVFPDRFADHQAWIKGGRTTKVCKGGVERCYICAADNAQPTASSAMDVVRILANFAKPTVPYPNVHVDDLFNALGLQMKMLGLDKLQLPIPRTGHKSYSHINYPEGKSAGVLQVKEEGWKIEGQEYKLSATGKKRDFVQSVNKIAEEVDEAIRSNYLSGERGYVHSVYPVEAAVLVRKPEIKGPGEDPKPRIIVVVAFYILLLAKKYFGPVFQHLYRRNGISLGLKWFGGDAERIWQEVKDCFKHEDYDVSSFDHNLMAIVLALLAASYIQCYRQPIPGVFEEELDYYILKHHLSYLTNCQIVKLCQWFDNNWRVVIGMMFSGSYETSMHDTRYHQLVIICWILDIIRRARADGKEHLVVAAVNVLKKWVARGDPHSMEDRLLRVIISWFGFGDDGLLHNRVVPETQANPEEGFEWFGVRAFADFARRGFNFVIKEVHKTNTCDQFHTPVDDEGRLMTKDVVAPNGDLVVKPIGVNFLKHCFVKIQPTEKHGVIPPDERGESFVTFPYRNASDYIWRPRESATGNYNPLLLQCKTNGVLLSSMGLHEDFSKFCRAYNKKISELITTKNWKFSYDQYQQFEVELQRMMERYVDAGINDFRYYGIRNMPPVRFSFTRMMINSLQARAKNETFFDTDHVDLFAFESYLARMNLRVADMDLG